MPFRTVNICRMSASGVMCPFCRPRGGDSAMSFSCHCRGCFSDLGRDRADSPVGTRPCSYRTLGSVPTDVKNAPPRALFRITCNVGMQSSAYAALCCYNIACCLSVPALPFPYGSGRAGGTCAILCPVSANQTGLCRMKDVLETLFFCPPAALPSAWCR